MAQATITPHGERMQSFKLFSGHAIPAVGLGTWRSGSQAEDSVYTAIVEVQMQLLLTTKLFTAIHSLLCMHALFPY